MCRGISSLSSAPYDTHTENCTCLKVVTRARNIPHCESWRLIRSFVLRVADPAGWGTRISRCRTDVLSFNFYIYEGYSVRKMGYIFIEALWASRWLFQQDSKHVFIPISVWCKKLEISKAFVWVRHAVQEREYSGWYREENVNCTSSILALNTTDGRGMFRWMKAFFAMKLLCLVRR